LGKLGHYLGEEGLAKHISNLKKFDLKEFDLKEFDLKEFDLKEFDLKEFSRSFFEPKIQASFDVTKIRCNRIQQCHFLTCF